MYCLRIVCMSDPFCFFRLQRIMDKANQLNQGEATIDRNHVSRDWRELAMKKSRKSRNGTKHPRKPYVAGANQLARITHCQPATFSRCMLMGW